jgi:tight adherence protein C
MTDWTPFIVAMLAFCAMGGIAFVAGQYYVRSVQINRRLSATQSNAFVDPVDNHGAIAGLVARHFDEKRFGIDEATRGKLRLTLVQAGYFRRDAINFYVFWRMAALILLPVAAYLLFEFTSEGAGTPLRFVAIAVAGALGIIAPDVFLSRKRRRLEIEYRTVFPDILDLLVVCVDAGLAVEGALDRITGEIARRSRNFGINLAIMSAEMRAGRSFVDALGSMADRLIIPEARSLVALLRQSREMGSDVGEALQVFSDEMRNKRLLRAEEQANKLAVKMTLPLALFIFPVVLMVVMLPVAIRIMAMIHSNM